MAGFLDTSLVVRYLTGSPPALYRRAAGIIDSEEELLLTGVVVAESAYVLTKVYAASRAATVDALVALVRKRNVKLHELDRDLAIQGLLLCRPSGRVSFADAMLWATARSAGAAVVYSGDERFPSDGLEVRG